ncbi:hypothetical protein TRIP_E180001 [uncultured Spirochaetota bacterium]|nr:hypothetical protein TRIP_E180001 [uncultured Spirochaetota bacterium]
MPKRMPIPPSVIYLPFGRQFGHGGDLVLELAGGEELHDAGDAQAWVAQAGGRPGAHVGVGLAACFHPLEVPRGVGGVEFGVVAFYQAGAHAQGAVRQLVGVDFYIEFIADGDAHEVNADVFVDEEVVACGFEDLDFLDPGGDGFKVGKIQYDGQGRFHGYVEEAMGFAGAVEAGFAGSFVFVLYYFHGKGFGFADQGGEGAGGGRGRGYSVADLPALVTGKGSVLAGGGFDLGDLGRLGWLGVNTPGRGPGEQQKKQCRRPRQDAESCPARPGGACTVWSFCVTHLNRWPP